MSDSISSHAFEEFFENYEKGEAIFREVHSREDIRSVNVRGGPLTGLKDFASRLPFLSSAFLTGNGTQFQTGFRYLPEGSDAREREQKGHFQFSNAWFYFSEPIGDVGLELRLAFPENADAYKTAEFRGKLDRHFRIACEKEPRNDPRRPLKFSGSYLHYAFELRTTTKLAESDDRVTGEMKPYWGAYRNLMLRPIVKALGETFLGRQLT
jgi:hypothetical protein